MVIFKVYELCGNISFDFRRVDSSVFHGFGQATLNHSMALHDIFPFKLFGNDMDNEVIAHPCFIHCVNFRLRNFCLDQFNQIRNSNHSLTFLFYSVNSNH